MVDKLLVGVSIKILHTSYEAQSSPSDAIL